MHIDLFIYLFIVERRQSDHDCESNETHALMNSDSTKEEKETVRDVEKGIGEKSPISISAQNQSMEDETQSQLTKQKDDCANSEDMESPRKSVIDDGVFVSAPNTPLNTPRKDSNPQNYSAKVVPIAFENQNDNRHNENVKSDTPVKGMEYQDSFVDALDTLPDESNKSNAGEAGSQPSDSRKMSSDSNGVIDHRDSERDEICELGEETENVAEKPSSEYLSVKFLNSVLTKDPETESKTLPDKSEHVNGSQSKFKDGRLQWENTVPNKELVDEMPSESTSSDPHCEIPTDDPGTVLDTQIGESKTQISQSDFQRSTDLTQNEHKSNSYSTLVTTTNKDCERVDFLMSEDIEMKNPPNESELMHISQVDSEEGSLQCEDTVANIELMDKQSPDSLSPDSHREIPTGDEGTELDTQIGKSHIKKSHQDFQQPSDLTQNEHDGDTYSKIVAETKQVNEKVDSPITGDLEVPEACTDDMKDDDTSKANGETNVKCVDTDDIEKVIPANKKLTENVRQNNTSSH